MLNLKQRKQNDNTSCGVTSFCATNADQLIAKTSLSCTIFDDSYATNQAKLLKGPPASERERDRQTDRQTERYRDREGGRDRQTDRQTETERQRGPRGRGRGGRERQRQTDRDRER